MEINFKDIPNLIFYGPQGSGKTTMAISIMKNFSDIIEINGSIERNIDYFKTNVKDFCKSKGFLFLSNEDTTNKKKCIFIDEADYLSKDAQYYVSLLIKEYIDINFIIVCNFYDKLIPVLKSLCKSIFFRKPEKEIFLNNLLLEVEERNEDVYYISDGDYRIASNINKMIENPYLFFGIPKIEIIKEIINISKSSDKKLSIQYDLIYSILSKNNLELKKIIKYFVMYVMEESSNNFEVIEELAEIEENINKDHNYKIQLMNFIIKLKKII